jgi:hypothetical protein
MDKLGQKIKKFVPMKNLDVKIPTIIPPILMFIAGIALANLWENLAKTINSPQALIGITVILAVLICYLIQTLKNDLLKIEKNIDTLNKKNRISIKYYPASEMQELFEEAKTFIQKAKKEISVVNSFVELSKDPEKQSTDKEINAKKEYFNSFKEKFGKVTYKRYVQIQNNYLSEIDLADDYYTHFKDIIEKVDKPESKLIFSRTPAKYPSSFAIIDGQYLLWEIYKHRTKNGKIESELLSFAGMFIIQDHDRQIIPYIEDWLIEIERDGTRITANDIDIMRKKPTEKKSTKLNTN